MEPELEEDLFEIIDLTEDNDESMYDEEPVFTESEVVYTEEEHYKNLASAFDTQDLLDIGNQVYLDWTVDRTSRSEWEDMTTQGLERLGLMNAESGLPMPFEGACDVEHPIILESTISYQSKTSKELLPVGGPCKTKILGKTDRESEEQAARVRNHMNYQLTQETSEYKSETEKMLFFVPLVGVGFKKKSYDTDDRRVVDRHLMAPQVYVNTMACDLASAERISVVERISRRKMDNLMASGVWEYPTEGVEEMWEPYSAEITEFEQRLLEIIGVDPYMDDVYEVIEQHCYLKVSDADSSSPYLDESKGKWRPFIVIIEKNTRHVLSIRRNWAVWDDSYKKLEHITKYDFVPNGNFYSFGFVHLLGNLQKTLTITLRSLMDSGQFANMQGGFKIPGGSPNKMPDQEPIAPGDFIDIDAPPGFDDIRKMVMALPFKEPSPTLFNVFTALEGRAQRFADSTEQVVADSANYGPVGTTMALLEASAKFFNAIHSRAYDAQEHELKIIARLNYEHLEDMRSYNIVEDTLNIRRSDYDPQRIKIEPVTNPNQPSQAHRLSMAQMKLNMAIQDTRGVHDMREAYKEFYAALDVENMDKLLPPEEKAKPQGPMEDIISLVGGKPIKAFDDQDHMSHIQFKSSWLQDPMGGSSPTMQQYVPALAANIREHQLKQWDLEQRTLQNKMGLSEAQAAQELVELHRIKQEVQDEGQPAEMIAKAELMKAQTNRESEQRRAQMDEAKIGISILDAVARLEENAIKAEQNQQKLDQEGRKMGLELLKDGLADIRGADRDEQARVDKDKNSV